MLVTDMPRHQSSQSGSRKRRKTQPKIGNSPVMTMAKPTTHSAKARITPCRACQSSSLSSRFRM